MTHKDEEQLRLLSTLHYVVGGLAATIPLFGLVYIALGIALLLGKLPSMATTGHDFGWFPVGVGLFFTLAGGAIAGANLLAAGCLLRRERRTLCLLTAAVNCLHVPLGTALGAFTISVLSRPGVRAAFEGTRTPPSAPSEASPSSPAGGAPAAHSTPSG